MCCTFIITGKIKVWSRRENKQSGMGKENGQHSEEVSRGFSLMWGWCSVQKDVGLNHIFLPLLHLSYSSAVLSRGWMESQRTFQRLQLTSHRMCLCDKACRERKSSSTSGDSIRLTSAPADTGRSWCNNSRMTGRLPHRTLAGTHTVLVQLENRFPKDGCNYN